MATMYCTIRPLVLYCQYTLSSWPSLSRAYWRSGLRSEASSSSLNLTARAATLSEYFSMPTEKLAKCCLISVQSGPNRIHAHVGGLKILNGNPYTIGPRLSLALRPLPQIADLHSWISFHLRLGRIVAAKCTVYNKL